MVGSEKWLSLHTAFWAALVFGKLLVTDLEHYGTFPTASASSRWTIGDGKPGQLHGKWRSSTLQTSIPIARDVSGSQPTRAISSRWIRATLWTILSSRIAPYAMGKHLPSMLRKDMGRGRRWSGSDQQGPLSRHQTCGVRFFRKCYGNCRCQQRRTLA